MADTDQSKVRLASMGTSMTYNEKDALRADWAFLEERQRRWKLLTEVAQPQDQRTKQLEARVHHLHSALESIRLNGDEYSVGVATVALIGQDEFE